MSSVFHLICNVYIILDSDLQYRLAYTWSLPSNTRFIERIKHIQDAANHLSLATEFLKSRIYYIIHQLRQAVMVHYIYPLRISIDNATMVSRSELNCIACELKSLFLSMTWIHMAVMMSSNSRHLLTSYTILFSIP